MAGGDPAVSLVWEPNGSRTVHFYGDTNLLRSITYHHLGLSTPSDTVLHHTGIIAPSDQSGTVSEENVSDCPACFWVTKLTNFT